MLFILRFLEKLPVVMARKKAQAFLSKTFLIFPSWFLGSDENIACITVIPYRNWLSFLMLDADLVCENMKV